MNRTHKYHPRGTLIRKWWWIRRVITHESHLSHLLQMNNIARKTSTANDDVISICCVYLIHLSSFSRHKYTSLDDDVMCTYLNQQSATLATVRALNHIVNIALSSSPPPPHAATIVNMSAPCVWCDITNTHFPAATATAVAAWKWIQTAELCKCVAHRKTKTPLSRHTAYGIRTEDWSTKVYAPSAMCSALACQRCRTSSLYANSGKQLVFYTTDDTPHTTMITNGFNPQCSN